MLYLKYIFFVIIFVINLKGHSQNLFEYGLAGGLLGSYERGSEYAKYGGQKGSYFLGINTIYNINPELALKAQLNYEKRSQDFQVTYFRSDPSYNINGAYNYDLVEIGDQVFTTSYNYLSIPVQIQFTIPNSIFYLGVGGFGNYLINVSEKPFKRNEEYTEHQIKNFDYGLSLSSGLRLRVNSGQKLYIEIRNDLGLSNISNANAPIDTTTRTYSAKLLFSYMFSI